MDTSYKYELRFIGENSESLGNVWFNTRWEAAAAFEDPSRLDFADLREAGATPGVIVELAVPGERDDFGDDVLKFRVVTA